MSRALHTLLLLLICLALGCGPYHKAMSAGDDAMEQQDYPSAVRNYQAALSHEPDDPEAQEKLKQAKDKLSAQYTQAAREKLKQEDYLGAIRATGEALRKMPELDAVRRLVREVSKRSQERAEFVASEGDYPQALDLYENLYEELTTERIKLEPKILEVKKAWATNLREKAVEAKTKKHPPTALLYYSKILQLLPDSPDLANVETLHEQLLRDHAYRVRLSDRPDDFRKTLLAILDKQINKRALLHTNDKSQAMASFAITIARPKFRQNTQVSQRSARYKAGTRQVPNPFYKSRQDDVTRAERDVLRRQEDVNRYQKDVNNYQQRVNSEGPSPNTSTSAEQGLSRSQSSLERAQDELLRAQRKVVDAKERLANESPTKTEDVYKTHVYDVSNTTLTGTLRIQGTIKHKDGREPLTFDKTVLISASDTHHPTQSIANIAADPLQLPDRSRMGADLRADARNVVFQHIDKSFDDYRETFVKKAEAAKSVEERLDLLILYILTDPGAIDPAIPPKLTSMTTVPDPVAALANGYYLVHKHDVQP